MKPCTDRLGHLWSNGTQPSATFHGQESVMVVCLREGCHEIGYRIVAQTSGSKREPD